VLVRDPILSRNVHTQVDEHFFLELAMDSRWRVNVYNTPKTREIHR
jgi:hypothetical protein